MKALQIQGYGDPDASRIAEVSKPNLGSDMVLIRVKAASLNPSDIKTREGAFQSFSPLTFPVTLGGDLSGTVEEVGSDVTDYKVGDEVFGQASVVTGGSGALADYASTKPTLLAKKSAKLSFEEAAALPLVGSSAVQAIIETIKLSKDQKILIHGGAGGIGSLAIQIAKHLGAYVATTASAKDRDFVKSLGADQIIDYKTEKFEEKLSDLDAVFDTVGGETYARSLAVLKRGGIIVTMVASVDEKQAEQYRVRATHQNSRVTTERLQAIQQMVEDGSVTVPVDREFPFEEVIQAFAYQETGSPRGKVVVTI